MHSNLMEKCSSVSDSQSIQEQQQQHQYTLVPFSFSSPFHDALKDQVRYFPIAKTQIKIEQGWKNDGKGGTEIGFGASVYNAAILLSLYLDRFPEIVYGKRVIELGCGPGLVGITCGLLGARDTYVTDGDPASVNLTQRNIQANNLSLDCCKAEKYLWGDTMSPLVKEAPFDIILGADIVACPYASAFDALLEAFLTLSDTKTTILLAYKRRHGMESDFFSKMETFFTLIEVPRDQIHGDFKDSDIFLYKAKRKSSI